MSNLQNLKHIHSVILRKLPKFICIPTIIFPILISGCAATYHPLSLDNITYTPGDTIKGISYGYCYNVLTEQGNKKYGEKENQKNIKLVAFSFTNTGLHKIDLVNDLEYFQYGTRQIIPLESNTIASSFEQNPNKYYADLGLMLLNGYYSEESSINGDVTSSHFRIIPIGLIIGPILTIVNISAAKNANLLFAKDLEKYSPSIPIESGQKMFVLIPFEDISERPIQIRHKKIK
jgi:hypothetical protein